MPQINDNLNEEVIIPSRTYKLNTENLLSKYSIQGNYLTVEAEVYTDRIAGFVDDIEAIKQAVYHILSIERYAYAIYDDNYGVELEQYIGQDFEYLSATIQETLNEALTQDDRIFGVEVTNVEKTDDNSALVEFNVLTRNDEIEMEVIVNV